jgi:hypothetical protein
VGKWFLQLDFEPPIVDHAHLVQLLLHADAKRRTLCPAPDRRDRIPRANRLAVVEPQSLAQAETPGQPVLR